MAKQRTHKDITMKELQRLLDAGKLISSVLTPEEQRDLREQMFQHLVNQTDMYRNQSLTR